MHRTIPTPTELRADIARQQLPIYKLAAAVDVHPGRLGMMLAERLPMSPEVAQKIRAALVASN